MKLRKCELFVVTENGQRDLAKTPSCDQASAVCHWGKRRASHVWWSTALTFFEAGPQAVTEGIDRRQVGQTLGSEAGDLGFDLVCLVEEAVAFDLQLEAPRVRQAGDAAVRP